MRVICLIVLVALAQNTFGAKLSLSTRLNERRAITTQSNTDETITKLNKCIDDNLVLDNLQINIDESKIKLRDIDISNVTLTGDLDVTKDTKLTFDDQTGNLIVENVRTWPLLNVSGLYTASGKLHRHQVEGDGAFSIGINNVVVKVVTDVTLPLTINNIGIASSIGEVQITIDGFYVDGEDRSEWASEIITKDANNIIDDLDVIRAIIKYLIESIKNGPDTSVAANVIARCLGA